MTDWEQFQEKYKNASEEVRTFIDSESIPDFAAQVKNQYALTTSVGNIIMAISDVALALQTPVDAVKGIIATDPVPPEKQAGLTQKLNAFLQEHLPNVTAPETSAVQPEATTAPISQSQPVSQPEPEPKTPSIPRYARPLTDTPRYNDNPGNE